MNEITNYYSNDTVISGTYEDDFISNYGSRVKINTYNGNDYVFNDGTYATIDSGNGDDFISNAFEYDTYGDDAYRTLINAGDGNDSIDNSSSYVTINGGEGEDLIGNHESANNVVINGDSGVDVIVNSGDKTKIYTGNDENLVTNGGNYVTITGGKDSDVITSGGKNVIINADNGDNMISVEGANTFVTTGSGQDTIYFSSGGQYSTINSGAGNDVIANAANYIAINAGAGNDSILSRENYILYQYASGYGTDTISGYNETDTIKIIDNTEYVNFAINNGSDDVMIGIGSTNIVLTDAIDKKLNIIDSYGDVIYSGYVNDNQSSGGNDTQSDSDGLIYNSSKTAVTVTSNYDSTYLFDDDYSSTVATINASPLTSGIKIFGSENVNYIIGGKGNDTLNGSDYGNNTLTGGKGSDVFSYWHSNDVITDYTPNDLGNNLIMTTIAGGTVTPTTPADTTSGGGGSDTQGGSSSTKLPTGLTYNSAKTVLTVGKKFADGEIYLSEYASSIKTVNASKYNKNSYIYGNDNGNTIKGGKKSDDITGGNGNDVINGNNGNDILYGGFGDDKINGGKGNDTLAGSYDNDTLTGGAGKDLFIYNGDGNDLITDYKSGQDKIQIRSSIDSVTISGKNVIFNIDEGTLTVKNGKNKKITFIDYDGEVISNKKYSKSSSFEERNFIDTDYWFANDDNFVNSDIDSLIDTTTYNETQTIDITTLTTDYTKLHQNSNNIYSNNKK